MLGFNIRKKGTNLISIESKEFHYSGFQRIDDKEVEVGIVRSKIVKKTVYVPQTYQEVKQQVKDFVDQIGRQRLVNICQYTESRNVYGDDANITIIVWYWED